MFKLGKFQFINPAMALRIGLGLILTYAAVHMITDSEAWIGFVPKWVSKIIDIQTFLYLHASLELIFGILLILGILLPAVSFLVFLDFLAILIFFGIDDVTFRDFGLLMASMALFLITCAKHEREK